jgi:hypothetical protein
VYEESGHFKFEMLRLAWDEWARCLVTDRFITDFSSIWRHLPHDENGVTGSVPTAKLGERVSGTGKPAQRCTGKLYLAKLWRDGNYQRHNWRYDTARSTRKYGYQSP